MRYGLVEKKADAVWRLLSTAWVDECRFLSLRDFEGMGWHRGDVVLSLALLEGAGVVVVDLERRRRLRVLHPDVARYTRD